MTVTCDTPDGCRTRVSCRDDAFLEIAPRDAQEAYYVKPKIPRPQRAAPTRDMPGRVAVVGAGLVGLPSSAHPAAATGKIGLELAGPMLLRRADFSELACGPRTGPGPCSANAL